MVTLLIERGADVNQADGMPAIDVAIDQDNANLVRLLIEHGADVNLTTAKSNGTPLHHACAHNCNDIVRVLLEHQAQPNVMNDQGITPLLYAAVNTNAGILALLLQAGADPLQTLPEGETALHIVAESGHMPSVRAFLAHPAIRTIASTRDKKGNLPVVYAAESSQLEVLDALLPVTEGCEHMTVEDAMEKLVPEEPVQPSVEEVQEPKPAPRVISAMDKEVVRRKDKEAAALFAKERYAEALELFTAALELDPDNVM